MGRCSREVGILVNLPYSNRRSTCYFNRLYDFLEPLLDFIIRIFMSTVSFLVQLNSGILCQHNVFLSFITAQTALSLKLIGIFNLLGLFNQFPKMIKSKDLLSLCLCLSVSGGCKLFYFIEFLKTCTPSIFFKLCWMIRDSN